MIASLRVRTWHVAVVFVASVLLVAGALAFGTAQTSGTPVNAGLPLAAAYQEPTPAYSSFIGWGQVSGSTGYGLRAVPVTAWYWTGNAWSQRARYVGQRVYIYPYTGAWSWTWTSNDGWMAMHTSELTIGYRPIAIAT